MTDYNDGKWHGWNGGECPVHTESVVQVSTCEGWHTERAGNWNWDDKKTPISSFRVVNEYREPREFWLVCDCVFDKEKDAQAEASMHPSGADIIHVREVLE